ncbi:MAG: beta-N-acetylhexosaminidase [Bdellovibrionales bacterium]
MTDKIGQLFIIGIRGKILTQDEAEFIIKNNIGGVILFDRNIESPEQIHALVSSIQTLRHKTRDKLPFFIGVDQEGGRVARMKAPFTQWPAIGHLGKLDSTSVAFRYALSMGSELRAVGINLDFAPCVDVLTNAANTLIGDRSLSSDPEQVAKLSSALVRGYIKSGVIPCAKHFPGHGNTIVDSHLDLPVEDVGLDRLRAVELVPFKKAIRARLDLLMTAHIKFPQVDPDWPVTLSTKFLKDLLRKELRYRNLVISDDLDMKALANHYNVEDIPVRAFQAGCDILLYCNNFDHPPMALEAMYKAARAHVISAREIDESYNRVVSLKKDTLANPDPVPFSEVAQVIGHSDHQRLAQAILDGAVPADLLTAPA